MDTRSALIQDAAKRCGSDTRTHCQRPGLFGQHLDVHITVYTPFRSWCCSPSLTPSPVVSSCCLGLLKRLLHRLMQLLKVCKIGATMGGTELCQGNLTGIGHPGKACWLWLA